jgi:uncharacterized protein (TIGR02391 family)
MDTDYLISAIDDFVTFAKSSTASEELVHPRADRCRTIAGMLRPDLVDAFQPLPIARSNLAPGRSPWTRALSAAAVLRMHILEDAQLQAALGPAGPALAAGALHPWVWTAASTHWDAGHHDVAVREAARAVLVHLREMAGFPDTDGLKLVNELFSSKDPTSDHPRLRASRPVGATDDTVDNIQSGLASLGRACVRLIRNVHTHDDVILGTTDALEMLATLSLFARQLDDVVLVLAADRTG